MNKYVSSINKYNDRCNYLFDIKSDVYIRKLFNMLCVIYDIDVNQSDYDVSDYISEVTKSVPQVNTLCDLDVVEPTELDILRLKTDLAKAICKVKVDVDAYDIKSLLHLKALLVENKLVCTSDFYIRIFNFIMLRNNKFECLNMQYIPYEVNIATDVIKKFHDKYDNYPSITINDTSDYDNTTYPSISEGSANPIELDLLDVYNSSAKILLSRHYLNHRFSRTSISAVLHMLIESMKLTLGISDNIFFDKPNKQIVNNAIFLMRHIDNRMLPDTYYALFPTLLKLCYIVDYFKKNNERVQGDIVGLLKDNLSLSSENKHLSLDVEHMKTEVGNTKRNIANIEYNIKKDMERSFSDKVKQSTKDKTETIVKLEKQNSKLQDKYNELNKKYNSNVKITNELLERIQYLEEALSQANTKVGKDKYETKILLIGNSLTFKRLEPLKEKFVNLTFFAGEQNNKLTKQEVEGYDLILFQWDMLSHTARRFTDIVEKSGKTFEYVKWDSNSILENKLIELCER